MSGRASATAKKGAVRDLAWGPDGLADLVPADQGSAPSLRSEMTDSGDRKLTNSFSISAPAGSAPEPNAGWGVGMMGEAGDFNCLTLVKLGPRPSKTGLFFRIKRESRCSPS